MIPNVGSCEFAIDDVPPGTALLVGDAVVFNVDGAFCATQAKCTHRGGDLSQGRLDGSTVKCPLHGAMFDVATGAVLMGPAREPLRTYDVVLDGDKGRVVGALEREAGAGATPDQIRVDRSFDR